MIIRLGVRAPIMVVVAWLFSFRISPSISMVFWPASRFWPSTQYPRPGRAHAPRSSVFPGDLNNVVDERTQGIRVDQILQPRILRGCRVSRISRQRIFKRLHQRQAHHDFSSR